MDENYEKFLVPRDGGGKCMMVILDGLGDRPGPAGLTPLEAARPESLSLMAARGITALSYPIAPGVRAGSGVSHFALFSYLPEKCPERGVLEFLGEGGNLKKGEVAIRCNFATVQGRKIADRRAGRVEGKPIVDFINSRIKSKGIRLFHVVGYRACLVVSDASPEITNSDPTHDGGETLPITGKSPKARRTAKLVSAYLAKVQKLLSGQKFGANALITRNAGSYSPPETTFFQRFRLKAAAVAGYPLYKGVARYVGMELLACDPDEHSDESLSARADAAIKALKTHDFVFLHFKSTDAYGEDGDFQGKTNFIRRLDRLVFSKLASMKDVFFVVTGDHSTPCSVKAHSGDPVPVLFCGPGIRRDGVTEFSESSCQKGGLGTIRAGNILPILLDYANRVDRYKA